MAVQGNLISMGDVFGLQILIVGVGACFVFDVWQRIFQRFTAIPPSDWAIVGRWAIGLVTSGHLIVHDLELRPNRRNELGVGWLVHYSIAVVYAAIYMLLMRANILAAEFADGLLFGVVSVVVPWLFFLPCLGKGIMGRLTPNPPLVCSLALMMHSIFGVAIGLGFSFFAR